MVGLYDLLLFSLGIDRENNIINEQHKLWKAYQEMNQIMQRFNTTWGMHSSIFNKNNLLEYHLAELFKAEPKLYDLALSVIDFALPRMECYGLYDSSDKAKRVSLKDKKRYMPCKEQVLAMHFAANFRDLWAAAKGDHALHSVLEIDCFPDLFKELPEFPKAKNFIQAAITKNKDHNSFLDVWQDLKKILIAKLGENVDLVSFDGHGCIFSFAEDLRNMQIDSSVIDPTFMKSLGFAVIDSYYGEKLLPFYRRGMAKLATPLYLTHTGCSVARLTS